MFNVLKKNKKILRLSDFDNKIAELAKEYGKDHWVTRVEKSSVYNPPRITFDAYIPDYGWVTSCPTVESVIKFFKEKRNGSNNEFTVKEVLIEKEVADAKEK